MLSRPDAPRGDCSICLLKGKGTFQHYYDECPELKGLAPEAITALKKEARAAGYDSWWNELQAKNETRKAAEAGRKGAHHHAHNLNHLSRATCARASPPRARTARTRAAITIRCPRPMVLRVVLGANIAYPFI